MREVFTYRICKILIYCLFLLKTIKSNKNWNMYIKDTDYWKQNLKYKTFEMFTY